MQITSGGQTMATSETTFGSETTLGSETILCWGAGRRLAAVGVALTLLWVLVWWAA